MGSRAQDAAPGSAATLAAWRGPSWPGGPGRGGCRCSRAGCRPPSDGSAPDPTGAAVASGSRGQQRPARRRRARRRGPCGRAASRTTRGAGGGWSCPWFHPDAGPRHGDDGRGPRHGDGDGRGLRPGGGHDGHASSHGGAVYSVSARPRSRPERGGRRRRAAERIRCLAGRAAGPARRAPTARRAGRGARPRGPRPCRTRRRPRRRCRPPTGRRSSPRPPRARGPAAPRSAPTGSRRTGAGPRPSTPRRWLRPGRRAARPRVGGSSGGAHASHGGPVVTCPWPLRRWPARLGP